MKDEEELCKRLDELINEAKKQTYIQSTIHKDLCDVKNEIAKIPDIVAGKLERTKQYVYKGSKDMAMEG